MSFFEEQCPEMDRYIDYHGSEESDLLRRLRRETYQKTTQPHMISGYQQGVLLSIISKILKPKKVLEIGTFTGYAALCMAEGLAEDGQLITLDVNEDLAYIAKKYFEESEHSDKIDFRLQNAIDFLKETDEVFDLIFIDADKENYVEYFNLIKPKVKTGSIIMFDNVLWYGKVLEESPKQKSTQTIKKLNEIISQDQNFENIILPIRDGLNVLRKK